ncbi:Ig-like domain-containing protein [Prevotella sp. MA2016]|uniref:Ig-like domain-containing protein n=1 Tax=Prevotella sp. MA2016 TaxID=1408310 RepID=UPI000687E563|nr:Ig-like domain-containing protein [Prevotella sp. MA2016]
MTKKSISRLLQASLMCCLAVLFTACDDIFASEDNPTPAYLQLSEAPVTIKAGDTYRRKAISVTSAVVEYTSSNTNVATVDGEGLVTAIAEGEATITATATGYSTGGKKIFLADSKSYVVTVTPAVTSLSLDKANLRFDKNVLTAQVLTPTVTPSDATITWTSSNENVATVDANGQVTPKAKGTATITAKAGDLTATSSVYVYDKIWNVNTDGNAAVTTNESWLIEGDVTTSVSKSITIEAGATVTLNGINITNGIKCLGDATIILADGSTNTVKGYFLKAGIDVGPSGTTLTIDAETAGDGKLNATGSTQSAGIGSSYNYSLDITCGAITIKGGEITAKGGLYGAGIGTGLNIDKNNTCGAITINGGTVTATGGKYAAGIGTGWADGSGSNTCGAIAINGGTVTATGGKYAAGIGTGLVDLSGSNTCGAIAINGGTVTATGGKYAAGIGTGLVDLSGSNTCGAIAITANVTKVTVTKGEDSPNIMGVGYLASGTQNCGTITFGTAQVFDGTAATGTWSPSDPLTAGTYGGLNLAISTTTNADDTWTLTPVAP